MARRTTSLSKGRPKTEETAPADLPEPVTAAPRRARKAKLRDEPPAEMPLTDAFFPGGDEPAPEIADTDSPAPAKARRGRKAKSQPAPETSMTADEHPDEGAGTEIVSDDTTTPSTVAEAAPSPAAQWNAETGAVTFDWPAIEQVAAAAGANQAMAKLLLAARAEGANSRWPF